VRVFVIVDDRQLDVAAVRHDQNGGIPAEFVLLDPDRRLHRAVGPLSGFSYGASTQNAAKGLRNEVFDVKLKSGDIAEAWREGNDEYVTVALRYESRDVLRNRATGELVSGEDRIMERSEVWTFVRHNRGEWLLSAIQGA